MKSRFKITKYIIVSVCIFSVAVVVAIITRMILIKEVQLSSFTDDQAALITSMIEGAVGALAAGFVLYELNINGNFEKHQNDIEEAQFMLQYNQAFIQDEKMCEVESLLEQWMEGSIEDPAQLINDENRQRFVNYLVYLESLAPLIFRDILKLEHIDDLMAYRFFIAMNNTEVKRDQLFRYPDYYRGCFKLYLRWSRYREGRGLPIPLKENSLDRWQFFKLYSSDLIVRKCSDKDDLKKIAGLIYDTDPYIYPAAFGNKHQAKKILPVMMKDKTAFNANNIIIVKNGESICGIAVIIDDEQLSTVCKYGKVSFPVSFKNVKELYFDKIHSYIEKGEKYIACVCIEKKWRGQGVGELILQYITRENPDVPLALDVLSDNNVAIHLYEKYGFEIVKQEQGYSKTNEPPLCYKMKRKVPSKFESTNSPF